MQESPEPHIRESEQHSTCELTVILPARNEAHSLPACLASLTAQSEDGWLLGRHWELVVVDDHSSDRTQQVAHTFPGVTVLPAPPLPPGWTGKANACWAGAQHARGQWLLFTSASTLHAPGSLSRSIVEANRYSAAMLSWSPLQQVTSLTAHAVMPLIFSELATAYPLTQVNDPAHRIAVANSQFLLVRRDAYRQIGGHSAVSASLVEAVDLAFSIKRQRLGLRFRYAPEMLSAATTSTAALWEGWVKNLALLINNSLALALWRLLDVALLILLPLLALGLVWRPLGGMPPIAAPLFVLILLRTLWRIWRRANRSHFAAADLALSLAGLPIFSALLIHSWYTHSVSHRARWKGRDYPSQ